VLLDWRAIRYFNWTSGLPQCSGSRRSKNHIIHSLVVFDLIGMPGQGHSPTRGGAATILSSPSIFGEEGEFRQKILDQARLIEVRRRKLY